MMAGFWNMDRPLREGKFRVMYTNTGSTTFQKGTVYVVREYTEHHYLVIEGAKKEMTISVSNARILDEDVVLPKELFEIE